MRGCRRVERQRGPRVRGHVASCTPRVRFAAGLVSGTSGRISGRGDPVSLASRTAHGTPRRARATMAGVPNGSSETIKNHASFIWSVADLLRGDYKQSEYGKVVLPLTVLRRFDCVLAPVKQDMLDTYERVQGQGRELRPDCSTQLTSVDGLWNTSKYDLPKLLDDPDHIADNLRAYIHGFSPEAQEILDRFEFAVADHPAPQGGPAVPGARQVRRDRPASRPGLQPGDGLPVRGADPPLLRARATRRLVSTSRRVR